MHRFLAVAIVAAFIAYAASSKPPQVATAAPVGASKPAPAATKSSPPTDQYTDGLAAMTLGKMLVDGGVVMQSDTDTSVLKGYRHLNVWISSLSPADARQSAKVICQHARRLWNYQEAWHVQVFISTGSTVPAGRCKI